MRRVMICALVRGAEFSSSNIHSHDTGRDGPSYCCGRLKAFRQGRIKGVNEALRRRKARAAATAAGVDSLLLTHAADVRYLTGFTGSNGALAMAGGRAALFTDGRYTTQARAEAAGLRVVISPKPAAVAAAEWLAAHSVKHCGFDSTQTTVAGLA